MMNDKTITARLRAALALLEGIQDDADRCEEETASVDAGNVSECVQVALEYTRGALESYAPGLDKILAPQQSDNPAGIPLPGDRPPA